MKIKSNESNSSATDNNLQSLRITSAICLVAGNWALLFEVFYFRVWSLETYFARVLFTFVALIVFAISYRNISIKKINLLIHLLIISLISSFAFTIYKIPTSLFINSQILSLLVFTTALIFSWEVKNQIIVAIYYNLLFAGSIFLAGSKIFHLPNLFSLIIFISLISLLSIVASAINYKLRKEYKIKIEEINFLFNSVPLGICRTDLQGNVITLNNFLMNLLQIEKDKKNFKLYDYIKNESFREIFNSPSIDTFTKLVMDIEYDIENNEIKYLNIIADIISDVKLNKSIGFIIQDKTDEIISQQEKERINKILFDEIIEKEQISRFALKEKNQKIQLLAKINHEVRTPLNSILMFHDMIDENMLHSIDEVKTYSKTVKTSVGYLLNTINNFIDYAKIETGKMENDFELFNIREEIESVIQLMLPLSIGKKIELVLSIESTSNNIAYTDPKKYRQIMINLIANSIKFTNKGSVNVTLNNAHLQNDQYEITTIIEDSGIGIPQEKIDAIFNPFVTLNENQTERYSSGLGLAICKEFIQMLNGGITVESVVDKGSKFTLSIPYSYNINAIKDAKK
jgi:signal transduction histidine kinase